MNNFHAYLINGDSSPEFRLVDNREIDFDLGDIALKLYIRDSSCHEPIYKIRDGHIYLYEWIEYRIKFYSGYEKDFDEFHVFFGNYEAEKDEGFWRYMFKNFIGKSRLRVYRKNFLIFEKELEVISRKFAYLGHGDDVDNYINFTKIMVDELIKYSISLPFSIRAPTFFQVEESSEPINPLFAYHFFKNNAEKIISVYEQILNRPHRKLEEVNEWVGLEKVTTIDEDLLIGVFSKPEMWRKSASSHKLAKKLGGFIPEKFHQWEKHESLDTLENRFAKYFLDKMDFWIEKVLDLANQFGNEVPELEIIYRLRSLIETILHSSFFSDVGELQILPMQSQVLLKREGYRDLLELWRIFNAYSPIFTEINDAIDNKNVDKLYEYWAFFRLVEELGNILGDKKIKIYVLPTGVLPEDGDVYAEFDNGWRLYYNKKLTPNKWSYSVSLKPDFSLFIDQNKLIGVFDAKFKLDVVDKTSEIEEFDKLAEESSDYETWAKLEDIYKMHTYKDALGCNFAFIVYPGSRSYMFSKRVDDAEAKERDKFEEQPLYEGLRRLISGFDGIGFLKFVPREERK